MGTPQCQQCQPDRIELDLAAYSNFRTTSEIEEKYRHYAESNLLGMYSVRVQKNIEKLYTLGQTQLCDRIIHLSCSKKNQARDRLLDDLQSIDLEELDHLALIEALPKKVQATYSAISSNFYEEDELSLAKIKPRLHQTQLKTSSTMRMFSKNVLREQLKNRPEFVLESNKFFVVATVGCFEEMDCFVPLDLPTRKSALRMFLEKIEATNNKYQTSLLVVFIVSPECEEQFDKQLSAFDFQMNQQQNQTDEFSIPFKFQKILYKPLYPCVDHQRKIKLTTNDKILFNYKGGDLVGFIMRHPRLEGLLHKYEIMQVANISNILENVGDRDILAYLKDNIQIDIVAPIISDPNAFSVHRMNRLFVEWIPVSAKQPGQKQHQLTHTFYIRNLLLTNKTSHFHKLLSTRIKSQIDSNQTITFSRSFQHILYAPITLFLLISKSEVAVHRREVVYSNYCKKILGIADTKEEQIVDICPQMLFGDKDHLQKFVDKLLFLPEAGFPLVLARQKLELPHSRPLNK